MSTCSVSKGCFVFKPSAKKRKLSQSTAHDFGIRNDDSEDTELRFVTCQSLWNQIKSETEKVQEDLNKQLLDNLMNFLSRFHSEFQEKTAEWTCRMKFREIPTAALVLGVNVTDHELTFKSVSDFLQNNITPYIALLEAKDCPGVKNLMQKLMGQLMNCYVDVDSLEDEDYVQVSQNRIRCSMSSLIKWYESVTKKTDSEAPSKKRTTSAHWQSPPVVVIFKDMESFTTKVLQDFIVICSQHIHELPLVLIFGIATSPMIIHRLLPHSVSSLLCIELFQSLSCKDHLSTIIDKLLLTAQFPFKLGEKVLQVLINIFLYHDFSVQNFIKGFQLCIVEHFYSQPLSVLCCQLVDLQKRVHSLSHDQCENIRRLPSFRRYVEEQESGKQVALLTTDNFLKEEIQKLLEDLHVYHENYVSILRCLHVFTSSLPKYPLGKQIRELHCACLENQVWETEEYESSLQLARMLNKSDLVTMLQQCMEILLSSSGKEFDKTVEKLKKFLTEFQNLEVAEAFQEQDVSISSQKELQKKTDLYHLQKTLLELKESRRTKKLTKFEMLRFEVVDYIDSLVRKYLVPADRRTLHEILYFNTAAVLRGHLNAAPRTALHTALNNPHWYLKNQALKCDGGSISNKAPDICIVYKLHLECGRLINLVDWLEAFSTVVMAGEEPNADTASSDQMDDIIHARFIRAVSELELLGFIKPSKQKTDHVARLTWGGC
ncbi:PREDICTED: origin recognition complex subunit 3 isoform X1 [Lepidothrix coronata]|uniref:Origin recognition complex subunit 3 n=1 Tax=Lepidothrix coronata TaxID=321398 RepID=A0A6J0I2G3_9PASS|nr:PREDICTED: origin recognition complex subunit 3 isoform X1 [Lepidothrix coronata]